MPGFFDHLFACFGCTGGNPDRPRRRANPQPGQDDRRKLDTQLEIHNAAIEGFNGLGYDRCTAQQFEDGLADRGGGLPRVFLLTDTLKADADWLSAGRIVGVGSVETSETLLWSHSFSPCQAVLGFSSEGGVGALYHRDGINKLRMQEAAEVGGGAAWMLLTGRTMEMLGHNDGQKANRMQKQAATEQHVAENLSVGRTIYFVEHPVMDAYGVVFDVRGRRVLIFAQNQLEGDAPL
jgi:hypothetical protein